MVRRNDMSACRVVQYAPWLRGLMLTQVWVDGLRLRADISVETLPAVSLLHCLGLDIVFQASAYTMSPMYQNSMISPGCFEGLHL